MKFSKKVMASLGLAMFFLLPVSHAAGDWVYLTSSTDGKKEFYDPSSVYRKNDIAKLDIIVNFPSPMGVDPKTAYLSSFEKWEFDCANSKSRLYGIRKTFTGAMATGRWIEENENQEAIFLKNQPWVSVRAKTLGAKRLQVACGPEAKK